jgi:hypothetical protein
MGTVPLGSDKTTRLRGEKDVSWRRKPVLVEVRGNGGDGGGLDVGRCGEVGEALGEVDGADALRQVGQPLDGRRRGPPGRRRQPPLHGARAVRIRCGQVAACRSAACYCCDARDSEQRGFALVCVAALAVYICERHVRRETTPAAKLCSVSDGA